MAQPHQSLHSSYHLLEETIYYYFFFLDKNILMYEYILLEVQVRAFGHLTAFVSKILTWLMFYSNGYLRQYSTIMVDDGNRRRADGGVYFCILHVLCTELDSNSLT